MTCTRRFARGFRPSLPDGRTDWTRYCLQILTRADDGGSGYSVRTLAFPDKAAALAHARAVGATFHT